MLIKPVQLFRFITLAIVLFVGFQLLSLVKLKQSESRYGHTVFEISRQQFLLHRIFSDLEKFKQNPSDENLIILNSKLALFKDTQRNIVKSSHLVDSENSAIEGNFNDQVLEFINETERLKSPLFNISEEYRTLVLDVLPNSFYRYLNGVFLQNEMKASKIENKVFALIVSLLALALQSFLLFYFEREIRL